MTPATHHANELAKFADCTGLQIGDEAYLVTLLASGQCVGFAYHAKVLTVRDLTLVAKVSGAVYAPPTYWRDGGRVVGAPRWRAFLSPVLPEGVRLIDAPADRLAA